MHAGCQCQEEAVECAASTRCSLPSWPVSPHGIIWPHCCLCGRPQALTSGIGLQLCHSRSADKTNTWSGRNHPMEKDGGYKQGCRQVWSAASMSNTNTPIRQALVQLRLYIKHAYTVGRSFCRKRINANTPPKPPNLLLVHGHFVPI